MDARHSESTGRPSLRGFWITFKRDGPIAINKLPINDLADFASRAEHKNPDAFEDGFDAIVVEIDLDNPSSEFPKHVKKRQINSFFPNIFGPLTNMFGKYSDQQEVKSTGSEIPFKANICGQRNVDFEPPTRNGRIINGVTPPTGAYPWQVSKAN